MALLGIVGSPRRKNTYYMVKKVLESTGKSYELIELREKRFAFCDACKDCYESFSCLKKDDMQEIYQKLRQSDSIVLGSPTYFDNVTALMKSFMDRCLPFYLSKELEGKKVGLVSVGNFKHNERDDEGNCKWCKEETKSVLRCLDSLRNFSSHLGLNIVGEVYAIHSEPSVKDEELINLGRKLR